MTNQQAREALRALFDAAVAAASPALCVPPHLPPPPKGRTIVIGAGKAAAAMAAAVEAHWDGPLDGLVVTRYGHGIACRRILVVEAAHPVADEAGMAATAAMMDMLRGLTADDLVLCLLSGGGSALLAAPAPGLTLADKQEITRALLRSGAPIDEINCVRKHLSAVKGGRLAQMAAPARMVTLAISDVPGDDVSVIASGPTTPDHTTRMMALAILDRRQITIPDHVRAWLEDVRSETPKQVPPSETVIVARPRDALEAAAREARRRGLSPVVLGDAIEGEACVVAAEQAGLALEVAAGRFAISAPCVLLSGGETTVTVRGRGRGGRNAEYLLALAVALQGEAGIHALAADTDGIDGSEHNAGALLSPDSLARATALGLNPAWRLADNDGFGVFEALDDLVITGPTLTNVNDFRAILIDAPPSSEHLA
ncbi:glycerate kinase type-2 family protein [Caulobacter soli]|uniref:glycerate kinase type-2 family protein n=1 Tax=Caulobacter soli TaxID=2708539 RepID=UPI0013E9E740|nr:glycerate kinase [Caulobacter soli]